LLTLSANFGKFLPTETQNMRPGKKINRQMSDRLRDYGYTVRSFALAHGFPVRTAYAAAHGKHDGPKTRAVRRRMEEVLTA
jgi:hypothetical protein